MGYEVRAIIASVREENREKGSYLHEGALYVHVEADFHMGKVFNGAYRDLVMDARSRETRRYHILAQDLPSETEYTPQITEDCYGDRLQRLEPEDVIEAIEKNAETAEYQSAMETAFLPALKGYVELWKGSTFSELIVLHYGY